MIALVGLGNPGKNYEKTVHNMGYDAITFFAENNGLKFSKSKYFGKVAEGMIEGKKVILLKPETFMNLSGKSVEDMLHSLKLETTKMLVISDDIDLDAGVLRVRAKGSAGTHNGLRDIVQKVGENFPRLRIGVGRPEGKDLAGFVLSHISQEKFKVFSDNYEKIDRILKYFIANETIEGIDITKI